MNRQHRTVEGYNFAYLDEQTKRMIRRALLKAVAIPGYQVPFGSREMPLPYGWGTGGIQVTASIIGPDDVLKVIDQGVTVPTTGAFTSSSPYYLANNGYPAYNLAKAKQLISEVKAAGGSTTMTLGHTPDPKGAQIGEYLQQQLQQAGMTVTADLRLRERRFINILTGFFEDQRRNLERLR